MTQTLKCPFCQQELRPLAIGWCCDCGHCADKELWQELIRTKQQLDLAVAALKEIGATYPRITDLAMKDIANNVVKRIQTEG